MLTVPIDHFMSGLSLMPVVDIRSASEFKREHLPTARHLPRERWSQTASQFFPATQILLYGNQDLRENSLPPEHRVQWLVLEGGYPAFLGWRDQVLQKELRLFVIAGKTGCGKTSLLQYLKRSGEQVIDLEALARHRGSVFGAVSPGPQSTPAQFLNDLSLDWSRFDPHRPTFIEWEADYIGELQLPKFLIEAMQWAAGIRLEVAEEERVQQILADYGTLTDHTIATAVLKLTQRLGKARVDKLLELLYQNRRPEVVADLLDYYDSGKHYRMQDAFPAIRFTAGNLQQVKDEILQLIASG